MITFSFKKNSHIDIVFDLSICRSIRIYNNNSLKSNIICISGKYTNYLKCYLILCINYKTLYDLCILFIFYLSNSVGSYTFFGLKWYNEKNSRGSISRHDQFDVQNRKLLAFDSTVSRGPLTVYGQVIFSRFPGITSEVQSPNSFGVPFYPELVGRVTGWYHKVIVIFLQIKTLGVNILRKWLKQIFP